ncbi:MAG: DeoR/GlpR family DNA-binding transcription regulator [Atopobiaceae bacterium]|jgi:DeoR/GlpR family transcriptional regulator of sugar metabolism|nr:DeoR/GlpR family DNA-binding transcription regulator [Atopobiaceae bacterium]MCI1318840.1 DeoR/GlpR family DNA-binding transcription regulator [Atopobiaceae bacterium]MCI1389744.1 DeoR/GlpR family DNA-binding transcription regulator [Atopobiaceae bacterium]MCI1432718.1 DeoR/GlpR family DNA-binding transcription regulator [Atopobiaceae bacterium]MCI1470945.1 DeoR/GlpR family DNA-binding transcription regulator [Atopobiaceae bacterium]
MARTASGTHAPFMEERRQIILQLLEKRRSVAVGELAQRFGVSAATIRSDIRALEAEGLLERTHGGAIARTAAHPVEMTIDARSDVRSGQKAQIARKAAETVRDDDFLLVDSGTTCRALVEALSGRRGLTILTNDIRIAGLAEATLADVSVIVVGGTLRRGFNATQGSDAVEMLRRFMAPRLFTSSDNVTVEHGMSTYTPEQAAIKRAMLEQSRERVLLADSSKFGVDAPVQVAGICDVDTIVTDDDVADDVRDAIEGLAGGPRLVIA